MKVKISKKRLLQVVRQVLKQGTPDNPAPKGTNMRKVLRAAQDAGKQGRSWTQLHNAIMDKGDDSDWSSQNRGNNISRIDRCAGRPHGNTQEGDPQDRPYENQPLIKKMQNGNYIITKHGEQKLRQLDQTLGPQTQQNRDQEI